MPGVELLCLLPARNAAHTLPGWFESVERCADAVIALDDGSTDATRAMLAAHPLVRRLLTNPVRQSYEGWDDRANRTRLLAAAAELSPAWILWLDADERIPPDDATALRQFLARGADRQCAYLVTVYPLGGGIPHPRTFGTFVRALGPLVRESRLFRLETAIRKLTADPCRRLGLSDRGRVAPGFHADLVLFDPAKIRDTATYAQPWSFPEGVHHVLVNGELAVEGGAVTGTRSGYVLRRPRGRLASRSGRRGRAQVRT